MKSYKKTVWLAKDENLLPEMDFHHTILIFDKEPHVNEGYFKEWAINDTRSAMGDVLLDRGHIMEINSRSFPEITFENSPIKAELLINIYK